MQKECYWILHGVAVQNDVVGEGRQRMFATVSIRFRAHVLLQCMTIPRAIPFSIPLHSRPTSRTFPSSISAHPV